MVADGHMSLAFLNNLRARRRANTRLDPILSTLVASMAISPAMHGFRGLPVSFIEPAWQHTRIGARVPIEDLPRQNAWDL